MSKKKMKKNWKRMQKAARKTYGDYGVSLDPGMTYDDMCRLLGIDNKPSIPGLIQNYIPSTPQYNPYTPRQLQPASMDLSAYPSEPCVPVPSIDKPVSDRYCRIKESDLFNLTYHADMSALYSFTWKIKDGTDFMTNAGTIGICFKDGDCIHCMTTKSIPFQGKSSEGNYIASFDKEVLYDENEISANDILMNACFHQFGVVSKPAYSDYQFRYFSALNKISEKFFEISRGYGGGYSIEEFSKRLMRHNILFVRACEFKMWAFSLDSIYSTDDDVNAKDLTFMSKGKLHTGRIWDRFSGAYIFNPNSSSCYKLEPESIRHYSKTMPMLEIILQEYDCCEENNYAYKKKIADPDAFYKIKPDDIVMIVYAGNHYDVDNIIELGDMSMESIMTDIETSSNQNPFPVVDNENGEENQTEAMAEISHNDVE